MQLEKADNLLSPLLKEPITYKQLFKQTWYLGFIAYGGPLAHIAIFKKKFVDELQWIDSDKFIQLTTICQSIPGPTSSQLLVAVCLISTQSIGGGLLAYILFTSPGFFFFIFAGLLFGKTGNYTFGDYPIALKGFMTVSTALVANAFWGLSAKYRKDKHSSIIIIICAFFYFISSTIPCMVLILFASSIYSYYFKNVTITSQKQTQKIAILNHPLMGKNSAILFISLFCIAFILPQIIDTRITNELSVFYRIGAIIIGGGHAILPIMWAGIKDYGYMKQTQFYHGFSIISCLPGPMFNLTSYIGFIINGVIGSIVCTIGINFPAFLSLLAVMPYWHKYRSNQKIQRIIDGLCCGSLGLILAAITFLWRVSLYDHSFYVYITNTMLSVFALILVRQYQLPIIIVMIIAAAFQYTLAGIYYLGII